MRVATDDHVHIGQLRGDLNSTIVKLLLANHGYSDKVQQDVTSSDGSMSPVTVVFSDAPGE